MQYERIHDAMVNHMPFQSRAQRGFLYANHPKLAKEFEAATPKGKKLPYHKKKSKGKSAHTGFMRGLTKGE
jgi:hypothetical protein